jgi:hypothetical protein
MAVRKHVENIDQKSGLVRYWANRVVMRLKSGPNLTPAYNDASSNIGLAQATLDNEIIVASWLATVTGASAWLMLPFENAGLPR